MYTPIATTSYYRMRRIGRRDLQGPWYTTTTASIAANVLYSLGLTLVRR